VPQLAFSHWQVLCDSCCTSHVARHTSHITHHTSHLTPHTPQVLDVDPFWVATTEEEREEEGEGGGGIKNVALELVMSARKRKGLPTLEQAVDKAEKQRTLARKR
jgi:hypothetical protein